MRRSAGICGTVWAAFFHGEEQDTQDRAEPGGRRRRTSGHSVASLDTHALISPVLQILNMAHSDWSEFSIDDFAETKRSQRKLCEYEQSRYGSSGTNRARRPITRARRNLSETTGHSSCEARD